MHVCKDLYTLVRTVAAWLRAAHVQVTCQSVWVLEGGSVRGWLETPAGPILPDPPLRPRHRLAWDQALVTWHSVVLVTGYVKERFFALSKVA